MTDPILWDQDDHTAAKHRVLRAYLDGWIAVMAQQTLNSQVYRSGPARLLLVDGFAGPGRYATGEPGSPLLMLDALLSHTGRDRWDEVEFIYLFIEHDQRRVDHLRQEIAGLGTLPKNVSVHIEELLEAARWTRTHDPSPGFREMLGRALTYLGVENVDLGP